MKGIVLTLLLAAGLGGAGCKKKAPETVIELKSLGAPRQGPVVVTPLPAVGPGRWEGGGVALYVPPGWHGFEGVAPELVSITQDGTGLGLTLLEYVEPRGVPRTLEGDECDFVDTQRFRTVPLLGESRSATCTGDDWVRQVWWGEVDGVELHVEVRYPPGRMIRGRQTITPLLEGLERSAP